MYALHITLLSIQHVHRGKCGWGRKWGQTGQEETATRLFVSWLHCLLGLFGREELSIHTAFGTRHPGSRQSTGYKEETERNLTDAESKHSRRGARQLRERHPKGAQGQLHIHDALSAPSAGSGSLLLILPVSPWGIQRHVRTKSGGRDEVGLEICEFRRKASRERKG